MADISKINGQNIKDKTARDNHETLVNEVNETIEAINDALDGIDYTSNYKEPFIGHFDPNTTPSLENPQGAEKHWVSSFNGVKFTLVEIYYQVYNSEYVSGTLSLYRDGMLIKGGILPAQDNTISINDSFNVTDARTVTYTLEGVDIKGKKISASFEILFYMPYYFGDSTLSATDSRLFSQLTAIRDDPFMNSRLIDDANQGNYIWLLTTYDLNNKIMLDGTNAGFYKAGTISYYNYMDNVQYPVTYNCYRSPSAVAQDNYDLYIEKKDGIGNV